MFFGAYDPRALPWAGMRQAVGLNQLIRRFLIIYALEFNVTFL
jgi:hypothetical protein